MKDASWRTGSPSQSGWYIIAVLYNNGLGFWAGDYWDSEQGWSINSSDNPGESVIAYIPLTAVMDKAGIEFPEEIAQALEQASGKR